MLFYYGKMKWKVRGNVVFDLQAEVASNPAFRKKQDIIKQLMATPAPFSLKNRNLVSGGL
jgi:hypothetical protein